MNKCKVAHFLLIAVMACLGVAAEGATITPIIGTVSSSGTWYLRSSPSPGPPDSTFSYGLGSWGSFFGNWNGSGHDGIGVFDPTSATWYLRNSRSSGAPDAGIFSFGAPGFIPLVGDWTGTGKSGIGVFDSSTGTWYLRNTPSAGAPDITPFAFGAPGYKPVVGEDVITPEPAAFVLVLLGLGGILHRRNKSVQTNTSQVRNVNR
jgi:hypothetical protein